MRKNKKERNEVLSSFIIEGRDYSFHNTCFCCDFDYGLDVDPNTEIPVFYSEHQAKKGGWVKTNNQHYCPPDKPFVWVCPNCIRRYYD